MSEKTENFINVIGNLARTEYINRKNNNDNWVLPSICIAQGALESGWNLDAVTLFGIKGDGADLATSEYIDGEYINTVCSFEVFESVADSVKGYYQLICDSGLYDEGINNNNFVESINSIGAIYATDPDYSSKIIDIINDFDLTSWDYIEETEDTEDNTEDTEETEETEVTEDTTTSYTIQEGDTLWGICERFYNDGSKCYKLAELNGIENPDLIYAGDTITLYNI